MHTFAQKVRAPQPIAAAKSTTGPGHFRRSGAVNAILHSHRAIGDAAQRQPEADTATGEEQMAAEAADVGFDFSRIPVHAMSKPRADSGLAEAGATLISIRGAQKEGAQPNVKQDKPRQEKDAKRAASAGSASDPATPRALEVKPQDTKEPGPEAEQAASASGSLLTIAHETLIPAPDGSPNTRTKVGVGEEVIFTGSATGTWKASSGESFTWSEGRQFVWTAPTRAASVTIELTVGKEKVTETMDVIEPASVIADKLKDLDYPVGTQGAGMELQMSYLPMSVSFGNVETKEESGDPSVVDGSFRDFYIGALRHDAGVNSGDKFIALDNNNKDTASDQVAFWGLSPPWYWGACKWIIPTRFRVKSEAGDGKKFAEVAQTAEVFGSRLESEGGPLAGRTFVTKLQHMAKRDPY